MPVAMPGHRRPCASVCCWTRGQDRGSADQGGDGIHEDRFAGVQRVRGDQPGEDAGRRRRGCATAQTPIPFAGLSDFVNRGGRILVLSQSVTPGGLPAKATLEPREWESQSSCVPTHPILRGITSADLHFWAPDRVISRGAYTKPEGGPATTLIDSGTNIGLEWTQLMESSRKGPVPALPAPGGRTIRRRADGPRDAGPHRRLRGGRRAVPPASGAVQGRLFARKPGDQGARKRRDRSRGHSADSEGGRIVQGPW